VRKALVIGIDHYTTAPLAGCVRDAAEMTKLLERNSDGSPNFAVRSITSKETSVTASLLHREITNLFASDAETALFYFAGHGIISEGANAGYIVSQDGKSGSWGISLAELLSIANRAYPRIKSTVIVLDSCHSGYAGEVPALGNEQVAAIGNGVTILTACHRNGTASEHDGHGLFTSLLLDALGGGAADICGRVTPASVYSHVDQTLGAFEQRPIYKANVQTFVTLRQVTPKVPLEVLRRLPKYFPDPNFILKLDPSFEPDRQNIPAEFRNIPVDEEHVKIFKDLQVCNRHGLVTPIEVDHMYYAAINSTGCCLTAIGRHYRTLADTNRI